MENPELEKSKPFRVAEAIGYVSKAVVMKTVIKRMTGDITLVSLDAGEALTEKTSPFDTFIQITDGTAEIQVNGILYVLPAGVAMIIPAHARGKIRARERFKMVSTVIKSGFEDVVM
jgi:quercetin dioxygenase-like cupin family protein